MNFQVYIFMNQSHIYQRLDAYVFDSFYVVFALIVISLIVLINILG